MPIEKDKQALEAIKTILDACQSYYEIHSSKPLKFCCCFVVAMDRTNNPDRKDEGFKIKAIQDIQKGKFDFSKNLCLKVSSIPGNASVLLENTSISDEHLLTNLESCGLESAPIVEADFEGGKARIFLDGLLVDTGFSEQDFQSRTQPVEDCSDLIEKFHQSTTAHPRQLGVKNYWVDAAKWCVCFDLEREIQRDLFASLRLAYPPNVALDDRHIAAESDTETGRCDIQVTYCAPQGNKVIAIEMKALRDKIQKSKKDDPSKWSKNEQSLEDGFEQAFGYTKDPRIHHSMIAIWNACEDEHQIWRKDLEDKSQEHGINVGWYRMLPTPKTWRVENIPKLKLSKK